MLLRELWKIRVLSKIYVSGIMGLVDMCNPAPEVVQFRKLGENEVLQHAYTVNLKCVCPVFPAGKRIGENCNA